MSCDVGEAELIIQPFRHFTYVTAHSQPLRRFTYVTAHSQPLRRFTYVTVHSPTLLLLHLHHSSSFNPSFASPTSQAPHLSHLASRPCTTEVLKLFFVHMKYYYLF